MNCPGCGKLVAEDFGMVTCSHCGHVFMMDLAGQGEAPHEQPISSESEATPPLTKINEMPFSTEPEDEPPPPIELGEFPQHIQLLNTGEFNNSAGPVENSEGDAVELLPLDHFTPSAPDLVSEEPAAKNMEEALKEIQSYADQTPSGQSGLTYILTISGVDRQDLRESLFAVLGDTRLNLDVPSLQKKLRSGQLKIPNLNPVKISVLVSRLAHLNIGLSWEQFAFTVVPETSAEV